MRRTTVVVIGGGQAGLATSACLTERNIDHVVLERGRIAERWRSERWDSLRLLTPRWQTRLPGFRYRGSDPDGFMTMAETIAMFERYASQIRAPVETETIVRRVSHGPFGYRVETDRGEWRADHVVVATGHAAQPVVPGWAAELPTRVRQLTVPEYRNPAAVSPGAVLVVGASASGVQLASELGAAGRDVRLAVGRHTRLPRSYRGRDIMFWLDRMGVLDAPVDRGRDIEAARRQPSMQLVGTPDHSTLDLPTLAERGVRLLGRATGTDGTKVAFDDDLARTTSAADAKLARLLTRIDRFIAKSGVDGAFPKQPRSPRFSPGPSAEHLSLVDEGVQTVIWAMGFRESYPWLDVPVLDDHGAIRHTGGITALPGLYAMGLRFMRRRKSSFIDGVADDARDLCDHIATRLGRRSAA